MSRMHTSCVEVCIVLEPRSHVNSILQGLAIRNEIQFSLNPGFVRKALVLLCPTMMKHHCHGKITAQDRLFAGGLSCLHSKPNQWRLMHELQLRVRIRPCTCVCVCVCARALSPQFPTACLSYLHLLPRYSCEAEAKKSCDFFAMIPADEG